ncbi:hypothetical protein ACL02S_08710 [Nocardia sp. 004]|uniref:hypothetical protein n=1 Tax=Nocardia sp. 004 TaxID=3385978 RepID=UPI00399F87E1
MTFFTEELHAVNLWAEPIFPMETDLSHGGVCTLAQERNPVGRWESQHAPDVSDPTEGRRGFEKTIFLGGPVWVMDRRKDLDNPSVDVWLATRVDEWNALLRIRDSETLTENGTLSLTEDDLHKAAQFLVELTGKFASVPQQPLR